VILFPFLDLLFAWGKVNARSNTASCGMERSVLVYCFFVLSVFLLFFNFLLSPSALIMQHTMRVIDSKTIPAMPGSTR